MSDFNDPQLTPAGSETPVTPAPAQVGAPAPTATPSAPVTPPQGGPQVPATGAPGPGWVPSHRVRETREAAYREAQAHYEQQMQQIRQQYEQSQTQLRALVGVQPPQNPQVDLVRQQFSQLFPGLAQIEKRAAELEALVARAGDFEQQQSHYWQSYGRQTLDRLFSMAQETYGQPLNEEQKRGLHSGFLGFVQSSPEIAQRYETDPTLVEEYWKVFSSSFVDPARRAATATVVGRVPQGLPQDTPAGTPRPAPTPQPSGLDERAANAWAAYQHSQLNK